MSPDTASWDTVFWALVGPLRDDTDHAEPDIDYSVFDREMSSELAGNRMVTDPEEDCDC